jgi:hypothetical protein
MPGVVLRLTRLEQPVGLLLGRDLLTLEPLCLHPLRERCCLALGGSP